MLRTESDVIAALAGRTVTLEELYDACEAAEVTGRGGGERHIEGHGRDQVWRRRVRNRLMTLKRNGSARRVGEATWIIEGSRAAPRGALIVLGGEPGEVELVLADAADFLRRRDEPFDLIVADPPYGLSVNADGDPVWERRRRLYANQRRSGMVGGYVDVAGDYGEFTHAWVRAAAATLRPGAYLAVVSGTDAAWHVAHAAYDAGLTQVCQIAAQRRFALRMTRQPSYAHWVISVFCSGPKTSRRRFFHVLPELPKSARGLDYPLDVWAGETAVPKYERRNALRYHNALPTDLVDRVVRMFTPGPDNGGRPWEALTGDPFLGSGTTAVVALRRRRRFAGADVNPQALRFTMARVVAEEQPAVAPVVPTPARRTAGTQRPSHRRPPAGAQR